MSSTNLSSRDIDSALTSEGINSSSMNAPVTSGNALHVAHAVCFLLSEEEDTVSHPVKAWTMERPRIHCGHQLMDRYASKM